MSLKLYKEQYEMLEKIAAEMHNANVKMAMDPRDAPLPQASSPAYSAPSFYGAGGIRLEQPTGATFAPTAANVISSDQLNMPEGAFSPIGKRQTAQMASPEQLAALEQKTPWHQAITDPIRRAAGWVDDHAQSLGGLTGAEAPWLKRTIGYGAPALAAGALGAGAYALANRGGDPQQQESLASADLYNTIRQLQAENAEFRAYFQKQASVAPQRTIDDLSLDEKREFFQKHASPEQQNQMFVDEVVKTAAAMLTVNGLENGSNPFDPLVVREAAVDLLRSKGYKV